VYYDRDGLDNCLPPACTQNHSP